MTDPARVAGQDEGVLAGDIKAAEFLPGESFVDHGGEWCAGYIALADVAPAFDRRA
jgi:hypothetical protein